MPVDGYKITTDLPYLFIQLTTVRLNVYWNFVVTEQELWGWLEPYVDDEEEFRPSPTEGSMTMGAWVRKIIR